MTDSLNCPECGKEIESTSELEKEEVPAIETDEEDDSFSLYGNQEDLFLCEGCSNPLGFGK